MIYPSKAESLQSMQKRKDLDIGRLHHYIQKQTVRQKDLWRPCRSSSQPQQWKVTVGECRCLIFYECTGQHRTPWLAEVHILNSLVEEKCVEKFLSSSLAVKKVLRCDRKTLWQSKKWRCMPIRRLMQNLRPSEKVNGAAAAGEGKQAQYTIWGHPLHCVSEERKHGNSWKSHWWKNGHQEH